FSDPMARTAFILFLLLSTPVGLHHQFTDPGISPNWKLVHAFVTFAVFFPSLLTFFNVVASLEDAGRARGGTGWLGWIMRLPWGDPALVPLALVRAFLTVKMVPRRVRVMSPYLPIVLKSLSQDLGFEIELTHELPALQRAKDSLFKRFT
ncbi:MAG: cbb3-type cytochrome c oxidase subunit I, partial [Anaerolineae bacterium]|nr:cbb3-type cytochrome c oxidase subunit I [Anaerolineae bacterium]